MALILIDIDIFPYLSPSTASSIRNHPPHLISVKCHTELVVTAAAQCLHTWNAVYLSRRDR